jgi:hypothetical protein
MRMAVMVRPETGVAEALNGTGEPTLEPLTGEDTETPLVAEVVVEVVVELPVDVAVVPTVMFIALENDCPLVFQPTTTR